MPFRATQPPLARWLSEREEHFAIRGLPIVQCGEAREIRTSPEFHSPDRVRRFANCGCDPIRIPRDTNGTERRQGQVSAKTREKHPSRGRLIPAAGTPKSFFSAKIG